MIIDPAQQTVKENHKLMVGSIVPRPIAFVSTVSKEGMPNLAPFSYFNGICSNPPTVMFAASRKEDGKAKDTLNNIRDTGEFVVNIVSEEFAEQMVLCSRNYDSPINEFEISGLTPVPSIKIAPPRVGESKVNFECNLNQIVEIGDGSVGSGFVIIGTIVLFHILDDVVENRRINLKKLKAIGRLSGNYYTKLDHPFEIG